MPASRSYLALPIDSLGGLPSVPYVWDRSIGNKRLVALGTLHTRDPQSSMYTEIEDWFKRVQPDLVLHESQGPARPDTLRDRAIERGGGIGHAYYLANRYGAEIRSGDLAEQEEFAGLLERYPAREVLLFLVGQRFLGGYQPDSAALARNYSGFFEGYLQPNGIPVQEGWNTWEGFLRAYEAVLGRTFTSASWDFDWVSPIRDLGRLNEIARTANEIRDRRLLAAIQEGLERHDTVMVIFGGWHVLALEPVLEGVLRRALILESASSEPAASKVIRASDRFAQNVSAFEESLAQLRTEHRLPGLAVAIVKDQKLAWSDAYGQMHDEVPVTTDTPFWIASVTKPILGLLFLQLEADGVVDLQDRINDVPGWERLCGWLSGSELPFGEDLRCEAPITIDQILHHTVNGEPGTRFLYNPIMYSRLSRYIAHQYGNDVEAIDRWHNQMAQLVEKYILEPAGMRRTMASQWDRSKMDVYFDMAEGYGVTSEGRLVRLRRPGRHLPGGAGIVSTVEDLARFDIALDAGVLGGPQLVRKLFTPATSPDGTVLPYAYGWYVQQYRGETLYWHGGWDEEAGFSALYLKVPERDLTLILLANGEGLYWGNPLDAAAVEGSPFARAFLDHFVLDSR